METNSGPWRIFLEPYRRYADFSGRSTRGEFLACQIVLLGLLFGPIITLGFIQRLSDTLGAIVSLAFSIMLLATLIPNLAVSVRRLHDQDKSGIYLLLVIVPAVGWLFWLILMLSRGTDGENSYGPDPRRPIDDTFT